MRKRVLQSKTGVQGGWTLCLIFLFIFAIMFCAPKSYDDFHFSDAARGSFSEMLSFVLFYGNGRFLGNLASVLLQLSPVLAALTKASIITGIIFLIPALLGQRGFPSLALSCLAILGMEPALFAQCITWTCGFSNYVPPVFFSLLALYLLQHYPQGPGRALRKSLFCIGLALCGLSCQLFVEHSVIVHLALAFLIFGISLGKQRHTTLLPAVVFLLAVLAGTGILLWIPRAFSREVSGMDGYRSLHLSSLSDLVFCCARNFLRLSNQYCGLLGLPLCLGAWFAGRRTVSQRSQQADRWQQALCILPGGYMLLSRLMNTNLWYGELGLLQQGLAAIAVLMPLGAWIWALWGEENILHRNRQLVLLGFALFSLAPLLIVHPLGYRVQFHSYIFLLLACFHGGQSFISGWTQKGSHVAEKGLLVSCLVLALCLGSTFVTIRTLDQTKHALIRQEMGNHSQEIEIFRFPQSYVHDSTDIMTGMYYYYEEPMDITFSVIDFDSWQNRYADTPR